MNEIPAPVNPQEGQTAHAAKLRAFGDAHEKLNSQLLRSPDEFADPLEYTKHLESIRAGMGALREAKAEYELAHPWGSMESAHPGFFGKLGHAFGTIGSAIAPGIAAEVPGSRPNLQQQQTLGAQEVKEATGGEAQALGGEQKEAAAEKALAQAETEPSKQQKNIAEAGLADKKTDITEAKPDQQVLDAGTRIALGTGTKEDLGLVESYHNLQEAKKKTGQTKLQHVAGTVNGAPAMANFDPANGEYTNPDTHEKITGFKPAPNYAQVVPERLETQTKELVGPDGIAHQYGWNPKTKQIGRAHV